MAKTKEYVEHKFLVTKSSPEGSFHVRVEGTDIKITLSSAGWNGEAPWKRLAIDAMEVNSYKARGGHFITVKERVAQQCIPFNLKGVKNKIKAQVPKEILARLAEIFTKYENGGLIYGDSVPAMLEDFAQPVLCEVKKKREV